MKQLLLVLLLLQCPLWAFAQSYPVSGTVRDDQGQPMQGAYISLRSLRDTTVSWAQVSDPSGRFSFSNIPAGGYQLRATFLSFAELRKFVRVSNAPVDLGTLDLQPDAKQLQEVEVIGQAPMGTQMGDTTQFNATAFKTAPDASAEDLVRKMPGVILQNGQVQAQGENVQQILIDGRPFFGNDPSAALRNLPAEVIDKIQVFDQQSEQARFTGFDDGQTIKTINIVTKPETRNGQFGRFYGGYGSDERYQIGGNLNMFNNDRRISIVGQSNNVNRQNFGAEDLLGVASSTQGRGRRGGGGGGWGGRPGGNNVSDFTVNQQNGIAQTHAIGFNYIDKWGEKTEITASYFFNQIDNDAFNIANREFLFDADTAQFYRENSFSGSVNTNHRLNMRVEHTLTDRTSLVFQPRVSMQMNRGFAFENGENFRGSRRLNSLDNELRTDLGALNINNDLLLRHRFEKRGRTLTFNVNYGYNYNDGQRNLFVENEDFTGRNETTFTNQQTVLDTEGWQFGTSLNYTEPVGKTGGLTLTHSFSYQKNDADRRGFDFSELTNDYTDQNNALSNVFNSNYYTQQLGLGYRLRKGKTFFLSRVAAQQATLDNEQLFPVAGEVQRNFFNIVPFAIWRYEFSKQKNLRVIYRGNTSPPSINQLQDVLDNSDPLRVTTGNPNLKQNFQHNLLVRYSAAKPEASKVFFLFLNASVTQNFIGTSALIAQRDTLLAPGVLLPAGGQFTTFQNLDGFRNLRFFVNQSFPLGFMKSNLNLNFSAGHTRTPGLTNNELNLVDNNNTGLTVVISSNISEKVDFTLSTQSSYNMVRNSNFTRLDNDFFNQTTSLRFKWITWGGIVLESDVSHQYFNGLASGLDQNFLLWGASLGKQVFKNNRGEIKLQVFDVLGQNNSLQRNVTATYIEDLQTAVLQRYAMLTFTYNLRSFQAAAQPDGGFMPSGGPGGRPGNW